MPCSDCWLLHCSGGSRNLRKEVIFIDNLIGDHLVYRPTLVIKLN